MISSEAVTQHDDVYIIWAVAFQKRVRQGSRSRAGEIEIRTSENTLQGKEFSERGATDPKVKPFFLNGGHRGRVATRSSQSRGEAETKHDEVYIILDCRLLETSQARLAKPSG